LRLHGFAYIPSLHITEFHELAHEGHGESRAEAGIEQPIFEALLCAGC
jgi:hypothetical protein